MFAAPLGEGSILGEAAMLVRLSPVDSTWRLWNAQQKKTRTEKEKTNKGNKKAQNKTQKKKENTPTNRVHQHVSVWGAA